MAGGLKSPPNSGAGRLLEIEMTEAKKTPKMEQVVEGDSVAFKFAHGAELTYSLAQFPEHIRDFFALLGMRTKLRNFTVPDSGEKEATPERMFEKLKLGADLLLAGTLRAAREAGEKKGGGTLLLEAAIIYKRLKAEKAGQEPGEIDPIEVAKQLESLSDEEIAQLKATKLFTLALEKAKAERQAAKLAAAEKAAAEEAENAPL